MNNPNLLYLPICILIAFLILSNCAIKPIAWTPQKSPLFQGDLRLNDRLTQAKKIDLLSFYGAEDFAVNAEGEIFFGVHSGRNDFSSGAILKIQKDGQVKQWLSTPGWVTGLDFDSSGSLIALMHNHGLIQINSDQSIDTLVAKTPEGQPLTMGAGLDIAANGNICFVNMSSEGNTNSRYFKKMILEMRTTGGVYCYNPESRKISTISDGNYFGNGLVVTPDQRSILVSETAKYRILRYWIVGSRRGESEIFMNNLPGFPNNVVARDSGGFWIGFTTKRSEQLDKIHPKPGIKRMVYGLPAFLQPRPEKFGMVMQVSPSAEIEQILFDTTGEIVREAGAVFEWKNQLYLGGDVVTHVSKISLD